MSEEKSNDAVRGVPPVTPRVDSSASPPPPPINELLVLAILASVQFASIVDFMVIMPLGPQLERTMHLSPARFGLIVSSYTFAAGLAGLLSTMIVDRFSRRSAFLWIYGGFLAGTLACGLATSYPFLLAARFLTGAFGGILGGMAMTIIGDVFPEERRGRATGALMSSFAMASIFGVPIGLVLGQHYGWQVPFLALAGLGVPPLVLAYNGLPPLDGHIRRGATESSLSRLWGTVVEPNHLRAFALTVALQFGGFAVLPYVSPFLVANVHFPESYLPILYVVGGGLTLFTAPLAGAMADRYGKLRVYRILAPAAAAAMLLITNLPTGSLVLVVVAMASLMVSNAGRMVPAMAMITSSVASHRRGGFLGANSAVQHLAAGLGTSAAGLILAKSPTGEFLHFPVVGVLGAVVTMASLWIAGHLRLAEAPAEITAEESLAAAAQGSVDQPDPFLGSESI